MMPVEAYQQKLNALAGHCRAVGRNPSDIRKSLVMQALVGDDRAALDRQAGQLRARGQQGLTGTPEQVAEQIMRYVDLGVGDFILGTRPPYRLQQPADVHRAGCATRAQRGGTPESTQGNVILPASAALTILQIRARTPIGSS